MSLTELSVGRLTVPPGEVRLRVQDQGGCRGLYIVVGKNSKVWFFKRKNQWIKLGEWPHVSVKVARQKAQAEGGKDDSQRPMALTLKAAHQYWLDDPRPRSPLTERNAAQNLGKHFEDWQKRDLTKISRPMFKERYAKITEECGPMAARNATIAFKSWWDAAKMVDPALPDSPTGAVRMHRQPKRNVSPLFDRLHEWHAALDCIRNPIRRDFYLLALLTGLRRDSLRILTWADVRGEELYIASPKRARREEPVPFSLPLVAAHTEVLSRLRRAGAVLAPRSPFIFPGERVDHITDLTLTVGEKRDWLTRGAPDFTPHALRACFMTAAVQAGVHPYALSRLVGHRIDGTADWYVGRDPGLRSAMELTVARLQIALSVR